MRPCFVTNRHKQTHTKAGVRYLKGMHTHIDMRAYAHKKNCFIQKESNILYFYVCKSHWELEQTATLM